MGKFPEVINKIYGLWVNLIMSPKWESILLFIFYLALRWFAPLKSLAIVLLGTSLLLYTKVILVELGIEIYRLGSWFRLLKRGEFILPKIHMERFYVEIIAYFFIVPVIFFPLYLMFGVAFIILALVAGKSDGAQESTPEPLVVSKMWRKLGWVGYEYWRFWPPLFRQGPTELDDVNIRWPSVKWRYYCSICLSIIMTLTLVLLTLGIVVFSLFIAVSILTFLLGGKHITIFIVSAIEIFVTVYDLDLTHGFYERMLLSSYGIPLFLWLYLKISKRIGTEILKVMHVDSRCSKRGRSLAKFYSKVPTSFEKAAVTLSNDRNGGNLSFSDLNDLRLQVDFIKKDKIRVEILDGNDATNCEIV